MKAYYQFSFSTVKNKKALKQYACYFDSKCKSADVKAKKQLLDYIKTKAMNEFVSLEAPTEASIEKSLQAYARFLPDGYHVPALCT